MNLTTEKIILVVALGLLHLPLAINAQTPRGTITTVSHKGNIFEVRNMSDTTEVLDPITMEAALVINNPNPVPLKFNNMNIYMISEVEQKPSITVEILRRNIIQLAGNYIKADGEYRLKLDNVVIGNQGDIVYYTFDGVEEKQFTPVTGTGEEGIERNNNRQISRRIDWKLTGKVPAITMASQVEKTIDKVPAGKPAKVYNQPVPCQLDTKALQKPFKIKNGAVQY